MDALVIALTVLACALVMLVAVLAIERRRERELQIALVERLCQRIQAPELAIAEHALQVAGEFTPPAVAMDDDEGHWEAKEQLAERLRDMELRDHG